MAELYLDFEKLILFNAGKKGISINTMLKFSNVRNTIKMVFL